MLHRITEKIKCQLRKLRAGSRGSLTLASLFGLALPLLLSPIWSRAYPVEYFGISALAQILPGLLAGWSTLAYHSAIHTPAEDENAFLIVCLALSLALFSAFLLLIICVGMGGWISLQLQGDAQLKPWLWTAPILLLSNVVSLVLDQWMARRRMFGSMAKAMVGQSLIGPLLPALGLLDPSRTNYILLSVTFSALAGAALRLSYSGFFTRCSEAAPTYNALKQSARNYWNFPRDMLPSHILTSFSVQLPVLMIARGFDPETVGHFARVGTLLLMPIVILGQPFTVVFAQEAGKAYRERGNCRPEFRRTLIRLAALMTPIYGILAIVSPSLYPWFYGASWKEAGFYAQPMAFYYWAAAVASPLGDVLNFGTNTKWNLGWQGLRLVSTFFSLWLSIKTGNIITTLAALAGSNVLLYGIYLFLSHHLAVRKPRMNELPKPK